jgi:nucleoside phosphorylase
MATLSHRQSSGIGLVTPSWIRLLSSTPIGDGRAEVQVLSWIGRDPKARLLVTTPGEEPTAIPFDDVAWEEVGQQSEALVLRTRVSVEVAKLPMTLELDLDRRLVSGGFKITDVPDGGSVTGKKPTGKKTKAGAPPKPKRPKLQPVDFAIISMRDDEFQAVLDRFPHSGTVKATRDYNIGNFPIGDGDSYRIATVKCVEQGNGESQSITHALIQDLEPTCILVVGIAGGAPDADFTLGDVIVSTHIHDFTVGAISRDGWQHAMKGGPIHSDLGPTIANLQAVRAKLGDWNSPETLGLTIPSIDLKRLQGRLHGSEEWNERVQKSLVANFTTPRVPKFKAGPIASSDQVIKDFQVLERILTFADRQIHAVEMESAGIYRGARTRDQEYRALAIRGLSDIVGLERDDAWLKVACQTAASFAQAFLRTRPIEPRSHLLPR